MTAIDLVRRDSNTKAFNPGETIFKQGDPGDWMCCLDEGEVAMATDTRHLETLSDGSVFGEMALVEGKPRSATAAAKKPGQVVIVNQGDFYFLVQHAPYFSIEVMRALAERVRRNTSA